MNLRSYQQIDADRIKRAWGGARRVLYVLPTGGGKTHVAVWLLLEAVREGRRALFLAHRKELVDQAVKRLVSAGVAPESVGVMRGDDGRERPGAPVQVASIQTLARREKPDASLVVVDEAHHAPASSYRKILADYPSARLLGLTATPYRMNGKGLRKDFDEMVVGPPVADLIAIDVLMRPRVFGCPEDTLSELATVGVVAGDYHQGELGKVMRKPKLVGDLVAHYQTHGHDRPGVVYAVDVAHARMFRDQFAEAGIKVGHIDAKTPMPERDRTLLAFRRGELKVITNCGILTEGWDMPTAKIAMVARPTMSRGLYFQILGRFVRNDRTDVAPVVLDHANNWRVHGFMDAEQSYSLDSRKRKKGLAPCKRCPTCEAIVAAASQDCPECEHEFWRRGTPAIVPAELVEVTEHQTHCAGWGDETCERAVPPHAMTASNCERRGGQPWRCARHSASLRRAPVLSPQTHCAGYGAEQCLKTAPTHARLPWMVRHRRGEPWRCLQCAMRMRYDIESSERQTQCAWADGKTCPRVPPKWRTQPHRLKRHSAPWMCPEHRSASHALAPSEEPQRTRRHVAGTQRQEHCAWDLEPCSEVPGVKAFTQRALRARNHLPWLCCRHAVARSIALGTHWSRDAEKNAARIDKIRSAWTPERKAEARDRERQRCLARRRARATAKRLLAVAEPSDGPQA